MAAIVFFVSSAIAGFLGFGNGIVCISVLALTHGVTEAAGLTNFASLTSCTALLYMLRQHVDWRSAGLLLSTGLVGVLIGVQVLANVDGALMKGGLGVIVIGICLFNLRAGARTASELGTPWALFAGFSAGALQGALNTGGPPIVAYLYSRASTPEAAKATTQVVFIVMGLLRLASSVNEGLIDGQLALTGMSLAPLIIVGLVIGNRFSQRVSPERFKKVTWVALGGLGLLLIISALA